jgi:hypothetical protein
MNWNRSSRQGRDAAALRWRGIPPLPFTIKLKRPAQCGGCHRQLLVERRAVWARQTRDIFCRRCASLDVEDRQ